MTARELTEWQAYERFAGPLNGNWRDEALAQINEIMQSLVHITASVNSTGGSPETKPQRVVRPWEIADQMEKQTNREGWTE
jgi:hypothetical protein